MNPLAWVALVVLSTLVGAEVIAWCGPGQRWLLRRAVAALPEDRQDRYLEEWLAELEVLPQGPVTRSLWVLRIYLGRRSLACALGAPRHLPASARLIKRSTDAVLACLGILMVMPLFAVVAVLVRCNSPGPVFCREVRFGVDGRPFQVYRFRIMYEGADERVSALLAGRDSDDRELFKLRTDPRVTTVGAFLLRTSLDQLPQLANVLEGEMSLVGPRARLSSHSHLPGEDPTQLLVKPGLTGLWALGPVESWEDVQRLDRSYVENWSLSLDLAILFRTAFTVCRAGGSY